MDGRRAEKVSVPVPAVDNGESIRMENPFDPAFPGDLGWRKHYMKAAIEKNARVRSI
jgi:hypothetical protein